MRSFHTGTAVDQPVVSLDSVTCFKPLLRTLGSRVGSGWELETSRGCDGASILLVTPAAAEVDFTLLVTETATGSRSRR